MSAMGSESLAGALEMSHGSHMRRHRSSPGDLIPAQHAGCSGQFRRPARLSLADVSGHGPASLASADGTSAALSAKQLGRSWRRGGADRPGGSRHGSESPVKRRRWTHAGVSNII